MIDRTAFKNLAMYDQYPFDIQGIGSRVYTEKKEESIAVETTTGEAFVLKRLPKSREVKHDSFPYTKFFKTAASELRNLPLPASNMLYLIISKLEINCTYICVNEEDFLSHFGYSMKSKRLYYDAITSLIDAQIIKKKAGFSRCYWVNANIIYNGDRTKIIK